MKKLILVVVAALACSQSNTLPPTVSGETIVVTFDGTNNLGTGDAPLPINFNPSDAYTISIEMHRADGSVDTDFNSYVRVSTKPGTVYSVDNGMDGRNVLLTNGQASNVGVTVVAAFGPTRIWVQDVGYVPHSDLSGMPPLPACANGIDDNDNGLVDYPADPGCYASNDDSEDAGTGAVGVSDIIYYALPRIADVRGATTTSGTGTPFPNEQVDIDTGYDDFTTVNPKWDVVVTGLSSAGFFITDVQDQQARGYASVYAYTFSAPTKIGVCDRLRLFEGTSSDFFGYTEMNFPTWAVDYWDPNVRPCLVPDAFVAAPADLQNTQTLFKNESGLVRVIADPTKTTTVRLGKHFGAAHPMAPTWTPGNAATNCDLNGDGKVNFSDPNEGPCANACEADIDCTEYSSYQSNGGFTLVVSDGTTTAKAQGSATAATSFDPVAFVAQANLNNVDPSIHSFTGNVMYFSGGSQFTIQARCDDDVISDPNGTELDSSHACVNQNGNNPDQQQ